MNKRGFTLIEIIVCIALLSIIGTSLTVSIVNINNKNENKVLEKNSDDFTTALNIYLATHEEVIDSITNDVEGAVISLELLKNEGLIVDNLNIDYKENYFLLSDAVLLDNSSNGESACSGRISISTIKSWELDKYDSSDVLYICPKNNNMGTSINNNVISSGYVAKGENPNNWVKFEVTSDNTKKAYFPNDSDKDLWRILRVTEDGNIKLIYGKSTLSSRTDADYLNKFSFFEVFNITKVCNYNYRNYYEMNMTSSYDGYCDSALAINAEQMRIDLYEAIQNKAWLVNNKYYKIIEYPQVNSSTMSSDSNYNYVYILKQNKDLEKTYENKIGNISLGEFRATQSADGDTYLKDILIGLGYHTTINYTTMSLDQYYWGFYGNESGEIILMNDDKEEYIKDFSFYPVITLDKNVYIKSFANCSNGSVRGSKECPYELEKYS